MFPIAIPPFLLNQLFVLNNLKHRLDRNENVVRPKIAQIITSKPPNSISHILKTFTNYLILTANITLILQENQVASQKEILS